MLELINYNLSSRYVKHGDILHDSLNNPMAVIIGSFASNGNAGYCHLGCRLYKI